MKTDSLFYRLFQSFPSLLFELMGVKNGKPESYKFRSVEIKQTAFRLDGVFIPQDNDSSLPLFFVEVQFQPETDFYSRFFAEIFLYLRQYQPIHPWQAVVIYPNRATEVGDTFHYEDLLASKRVHRIYLQELTENEDDESIVIGLVKLIVM